MLEVSVFLRVEEDVDGVGDMKRAAMGGRSSSDSARAAGESLR